MEYGSTLVNLLKSGIANSYLFPFDTSPNRKKGNHQHMKVTALMSNSVIPLDDSSYYFEIGNSNAEELTPHYHILEDAKIIRFAKHSTKITRGSQDFVEKKGLRDYSGYKFRARTQTKGSQFGDVELFQEYRQNQSRNFWGDAAKAREYTERVKHHHKNNRNYYENVHWKYIERILEQLVPVLAIKIGAKLVKTSVLIGKDEVGALGFVDVTQKVNEMNEQGEYFNKFTGELLEKIIT